MKKLTLLILLLFFSSTAYSVAYYRGSGNKSEYRVYGNLEYGVMRSIVLYPKNFETITQSVKINPASYGKYIYFSIDVEATKVIGWAGLWMRLEDSNEKSIGFDNMRKKPITGTSGWIRYTNKLYVPKEARTLVYGVLLSGAGKVRVRDYYLR